MDLIGAQCGVKVKWSSRPIQMALGDLERMTGLLEEAFRRVESL
jgi:hypothetical protein